MPPSLPSLYHSLIFLDIQYKNDKEDESKIEKKLEKWRKQQPLFRVGKEGQGEEFSAWHPGKAWEPRDPVHNSVGREGARDIRVSSNLNTE